MPPRFSPYQILPALLTAFGLAVLLLLPPRPSEWLVVLIGLPLIAAWSWALARARARTWPSFIRGTADVHLVLLALLYGLGLQFADVHALGITTDGAVYFAQLRSIVFDQDLDVAGEFAALQQPGRPNHIVPIGPTLVWAPLYLAVAAVDRLGQLVGAWSPHLDRISLGLGPPYVRSVLVSSYLVAAAGLIVLHSLLRERFSRAAAGLATLLVFGATSLFWYMVYEPSMTHAASFGFAAFFVVATVRWIPQGPTRRQAIGLGMLLGLAFLARPQDALFAIVPAVFLLAGSGRPLSPLPPEPQPRGWVYQTLDLARWGALGFAPFVLLQGVHSAVLFSREEYALVRGGNAYLDPFSSRWVDTLFSSWHGFFAWTPVAYLAAVGVLLLVRRDWRWVLATFVLLFVMAWVNGSTQDWAAGWAFGGRRFTSVLVMLAPGLALLVDLARRRPLVAIVPLVAAALWWNHLLMTQYTVGLLPKDEPISFGRMVRQQAELGARPPFFYPFAFPANAWFAWREGLPVDRYDLLGSVIPAERFELRFDGAAQRFLLDGWDAPGGDDWGPCWWIGGTPATLVVPLRPEPARDLTLEVTARTRLDEPPVRASLAIDLNGREIGRFVAGVPEPSTARIELPAAAVRTLLRDGFNRLAFRSLGTTPLGDADARSALAPAPRGVWPVAIYRVTIAADGS